MKKGLAIFEPGFVVVPSASEIGEDLNNLHETMALWKQYGKLDLLRRFVLSSSKILSVGLLAVLNLESLSIISTRQITAIPYFILMLSCLCLGGMVEPVMSIFPNFNRKYLSVYNGVFNFIENTLLNLFATCILFCGYYELPEIKNAWLPSRTCIYSHKGEIALVNLFLIPLNILSAFMEFSKYKKTYTRKNFSKKCIDITRSIVGRVLFTIVNSLLAGISFTLVTVTILSVNRMKSEVHWYQLLPSAFFAILCGTIEYIHCKYHNVVSNKVNLLSKFVYFSNELLRPTFGNCYAGIYIAGTALPIIFHFKLTGLSGTPLKILEAIAYGSMVGFDFLRALDAIWYKYRMPDQLLASHVNDKSYGTIPSINRTSQISRNRSSIFNRLCCCKRREAQGEAQALNDEEGYYTLGN